jgi:hypothetical protein
MRLDEGDLVPASRLPRPLSGCLPRGEGASFRLHGWDNEEAPDQSFADDFDDVGEDDDDLLIGVKRRFGPGFPPVRRSPAPSISKSVIEFPAPHRPSGAHCLQTEARSPRPSDEVVSHRSELAGAE